MARARWLKPEFFTDAKVCQVDDKSALVFAAIWNEADDGGVAPGDPRDLYGRRFLKRERWGWTVDVVGRCLEDLEAVELAFPIVYRGERFVFIPEFARKQGIKPKLWRHLGPDHDAITQALMEAVLLKKNGGGARSNGVPTARNAGSLPQDTVSLPLTPKPLAVAIAVADSRSHKPQPAAAAAGTARALSQMEYAVRCVVVVNQVLEERLAGAYNALVASTEKGTAAGWQAAGIPIELAERVLAEIAARFPSERGRQPHSLTYFTGPLEEAHAKAQGKAAPRPSGYTGTPFREASVDD